MKSLYLLIALVLSSSGCLFGQGQNIDGYTYYPIGGTGIGFSPRKFAEATAKSEEKRQERLKEARRERREQEQIRLLREIRNNQTTQLYRSPYRY